MQVFGVIGNGADTLLERMAGRLDGFAVVYCRTPTGWRSDGGVVSQHRSNTTYDLSGNGWRATGEDLALGDVIDRLAPYHQYAAIVGLPEADLPHIVLDQEHDGETIYEARDAEAVNLDEVLARLNELDPYETLNSLVTRVKDSPDSDQAGAIATFTGQVRAKDSPNDERTEHLAFEKYNGVADRRLRQLEAELEDRDGVLAVKLHHRTGVIPSGEDIVFVVVLAGHRREAFRTVEDGIDRLKEEVPIFKKEVTVEDEFWVHERDSP